MCKRCGWVFDSEKMLRYHDERWCKPVHDDRELYAMLILEGMQAGLSWSPAILPMAASWMRLASTELATISGRAPT